MHSFRFAGTSLALSIALLVQGCHAQQTPAKLPPDLARRVELTVRSRGSLPPSYQVRVGERRPSKITGFDELPVFLSDQGMTPDAPGKPASQTAEREIDFLLSKDERSLVQMSTFDLTKDPRTLTSDAGRPARGGGANAPVVVVGYDDLECPFCARMHAQLFPALLQRYGDKVRVVYKDFPLSQHPWAVHAAVDADCLGDQSAAGYWNLVDTLHAHAGEIGGEEKSLTAAKIELDRRTTEEGTRQKVDLKKLDACIARQDEAPVNAGLREGEQLHVDGVPALFINGEQISGAVPVELVYRAIDRALEAQGITPPPPPAARPVAPAAAAPAAGSSPSGAR